MNDYITGDEKNTCEICTALLQKSCRLGTLPRSGKTFPFQLRNRLIFFSGTMKLLLFAVENMKHRISILCTESNNFIVFLLYFTNAPNTFQQILSENKGITKLN